MKVKKAQSILLFLLILMSLTRSWAQDSGNSGAAVPANNTAAPATTRPTADPQSTTTSPDQPNQSDQRNGADSNSKSNAPPESARGSQGTWNDVKTLDALDDALQGEVKTKLRSLPRFGEDFFKRSVEELVKSQAGAVPEDYAISTGDELTVTTYNTKGGATVQNAQVGNMGDTYLKGLGPMSVAGMTRKEAESTIDARYQARFPNMRSRVTFAKIPQINVTVLGEARVPGSYQMNPGSTVLDALLFARGPSDSGSYRAVQLQRDGRSIALYDIYNVLVYGKTAATRLRNGDRIFIPLMGSEVAISGEVKRPGRYEILQEKNLEHLLGLAGGVVAEGYAQVLKVNRVSDNRTRKVVDVALKQAPQFALKPGDMVTVDTVVNNLDNGVYLSGAVRRPGWYQLEHGMKVSDLIRQAEGLAQGAYGGHSELFREGGPTEPLRMRGFELELALSGDPNHNIILAPRDRVIIYDASEALFNKERVRIQGEVSQPGEYPRYQNMKIRDLLMLAGGTTPEAATKAEITRPGPDGRLAFIPVDLDAVKTSTDSSENIELQPLDVVIIRKELRKKRWPASITLAGEFINPGVYTVDPERETLQSVIERAGGLTPEAYPMAASFNRPKDEILRPDISNLAKEVFTNIQEVVSQIAKVENARRSRAASQSSTDLASLAGGEVGELPRVLDKILATDRIPVDLIQMLNQGTGDPGVKNGDVLYVPQKPEMVVVSGAVLMPSPIVWQPGKSSRAYIKRTGGFAKDAAEDEVVVMRVSGELLKERDAGDIQPGDLILVPPKAIIAYPGAFERFLNVLQVVAGGFFTWNVVR